MENGNMGEMIPQVEKITEEQKLRKVKQNLEVQYAEVDKEFTILKNQRSEIIARINEIDKLLGGEEKEVQE